MMKGLIISLKSYTESLIKTEIQLLLSKRERLLLGFLCPVSGRGRLDFQPHLFTFSLFHLTITPYRKVEIEKKKILSDITSLQAFLADCKSTLHQSPFTQTRTNEQAITRQLRCPILVSKGNFESTLAPFAFPCGLADSWEE